MCGSVLVQYILVKVVECWWFAACDVDAEVWRCDVWQWRCDVDGGVLVWVYGMRWCAVAL